MVQTYWNSWTLPRYDAAVDIMSKLHISQLAAHCLSHLQVHNGMGIWNKLTMLSFFDKST
jgi:hypothetical protein